MLIVKDLTQNPVLTPVMTGCEKCLDILQPAKHAQFVLKTWLILSDSHPWGASAFLKLFNR